MDPDTMTVTTTDGFSGISLPVAEDVVLGGGETELSDFLNRPDWGTGAVLELEVTGGKITALTAWEARFSVEELAPGTISSETCTISGRRTPVDFQSASRRGCMKWRRIPGG